MDTALVHVHDNVNGNSWSWIYSEYEWQYILRQWAKMDTLLVGMKSIPFFENCEAWIDLKPKHYNLLITNAFTRLDRLPEDQRADINTDCMETMHFLIGAMMASIAQKANCVAQVLTVTRTGDVDVVFDIHARIVDDMENYKKIEMPKLQSPLRIVVDNTKN